ncbi:hypothetical protein G7Y89_g6596 [Cudoniella acicularis]|uniref:TRIP4/RQT4 C2HC5-type zinc finger domain-containing protein n=1 Tax=Cudoniella acicularis TaxID=354080 RepID=A0A8H4RK49_9HELO|nr:hypothetical protein G7Y89_g6596 [Cudoniella acicularis]
MSVAQLSKLLPLPEEDLQQVVNYASILTKQEAADHFNNLLGESPGSIEFISSFNSRRQDPSSSSKAPQTNAGVAYQKKNEDDYISKKPLPTASSSATNASTVDPKPAAIQALIPKPPPSATRTLISDFKTKSSSSSRVASQNPSRNSSLAPKATTKVNIIRGTSMYGASSVLSELDAAIRSLEISTNNTLLLPASQRACNCIATRHPLLASAPNCLNCGKVICVKEGLGPCTFCEEPLLSAVEVQGMIRSLREERGREKMVLDNASHRRAEISKKPAPFFGPRPGQNVVLEMTEAERKAKEHRDRLLGF